MTDAGFADAFRESNEPERRIVLARFVR